MKKSLLALAVLGAFAGAASAQSSVTMYGKVDLGLGKPVGSRDKQVLDGGASRLGFRGQEDLGGGLFAIFGFEHRFSPDTGVDTSTGSVSRTTPQPAFWNGHSWVGVRSAWGQLTLGRQYTPAFSLVQNQIDPFAGDTVASLRTIGTQMGPSATPGTAAQTIGTMRVSDSVRYDATFAGVNLAASIAEADQSGTFNDGPDRPWSVAANYSAGPLFVGVSYENPADADDHLWNVGARYTFGPVTLRAGYSQGRTAIDEKGKGWLVGANVTLGPGELKVGYARREIAGTVINSKAGVGYQYNLSKRTYLYADLAREGKVTTPTDSNSSKVGYDLGIQHNF